MNKKNLVLLVVVVLVVVGVALKINKSKEETGYSVVYLTTGEAYVGFLTTFPDFQLKGSYILQVTKNATDPEKNDFQLNPINEALWAPEVLHINRKHIVFYGPLMANSKIAETLAAKKAE